MKKILVIILIFTACGGNSWIREDYKEPAVSAAVAFAGEQNRSNIEGDLEGLCEIIHSDLDTLLDFDYSSPFDVDEVLFSLYESARLSGATPEQAFNFYWAFDDYCMFTPRVWNFSSSWGQALTRSVQGLESLFQRYNP